MNIIEILEPKLIHTDVSAKNKEEILDYLGNSFFEEGYVDDVESYLKDVYKREQEGSTGIGNFVAIPHGKSAHVKKNGVAIGILKDEIEWETLDDKGVRVVILFGVGNDVESAKEHLRLLAGFARKLGNDETVSKLINATTDEVIDAFK